MNMQDANTHQRLICTPLVKERLQADYAEQACELMQKGHCTVKLAPLGAHFFSLADTYDAITPETKATFTFPSRTDGFLPFGMERSSTTGQVDQCERFCFREKYRLDHQRYAFADTPFYASICAFERMASAVAQNILDHISSAYGSTQPMPIRDASFLQFCAYRLQHRLKGRTHLQDRHEDGNLLSLIIASCDGLVIYPKGQPQAVVLAPGEALLITGSILTLLSDGQVPCMDHAVLPPSQQSTRSSLVYFAIPDLTRHYQSWVEHHALDIKGAVNRKHQDFGNRPFSRE